MIEKFWKNFHLFKHINNVIDLSLKSGAIADTGAGRNDSYHTNQIL